MCAHAIATSSGKTEKWADRTDTGTLFTGDKPINGRADGNAVEFRFQATSGQQPKK
jgi:hypothetical protein